MKPVFTLLFMTFMVTACAPLVTYYREGVPVARLEQDLNACRISALKSVPVEMKTRYIPATYRRQRYCKTAGHCHYHQILISPARFEQYDVNASLREKTASLCMAQKNYTKVKLPQCDATTTQSVDLAATSVLPPINEQSCVIRLKSGRWQIVTP